MTGDNGIVKRLEIQGIVRSTSPMNNADGTCEEIINLRQDDGVWRVIGEKKVKFENVQYEQVFVHQYSHFENYIGVRDGRVVWFDANTKEEKQEICRVEGEVNLEQMNNILLVRDSSNIIKAVFKEDKYTSEFINLPDIPLIEVQTEAITADGQILNIDVDMLVSSQSGSEIRRKVNPESVRDACDEILSEINRIKKVNESFSGYVFICANYELYDGTETKFSSPVLKLLGKQQLDALVDLGNENNGEYRRFKLQVQGIELEKLKLRPQEMPDYDLYQDIIKGINVYVSKPFPFYDVKYVAEEWKFYLSNKSLKVDEINKLLFYRAAHFPLNNEAMFKNIEFEDITSNSTLPVDASGWLSTTGDMFVYNNRLHLYNVCQKFLKSDRLFSVHFNAIPEDSREVEADYVFYIKNLAGDGKIVIKDKIYKKGNETIIPNFVSFADSRAYKCEIFFTEEGKRYKNTVFLNQSATYNFSFYFSDKQNVAECKETKEVPSESDIIKDGNKILVSETANPYFFPVEHSYNLPGEIINLAVNTQQISASQIGQFPLYAFTTEGIYALQQGEGNVLYSNIIPVSAEVALKGSSVLQTKYGIVFVTADGLKLISGSEVVDLSEPVKGRIDEYFLKQESYDFAVNSEQYYWNASPFLSRIPFEEYVREAVMGYDIVKDEIIVSNPAHRYSYVYSLKTKTWHKITEVFSSFNRHLALKQNWPSGHDVCDIREEVKGIRPVLVLTRPVNLGSFGYKTIYHFCWHGEIRPLKQGEKRNGVGVFISNDLQNWRFAHEANPIIDMPVIPLERCPVASRYLRLLFTGEVEPEHTLSVVEMEGEEKFDNKVR